MTQHRRADDPLPEGTTSSPTLPRGQIDERLADQIAFLAEIDKLKRVVRQSVLTDGSRRENTAEHSWHLAMFAIVLAEWSAEPVEVHRVIELLLVHDLVEIHAGDTFVYAAESADAVAEQEAREAAAADALFGLLPAEQGAHLRSRWDEFEARATAESRFAKSIDRLAPMLLNHLSGGGGWSEHGITADRPRHLIDRTMPPGSPALAAYAHALIDHAVLEGTIAPPVHSGAPDTSA